MASGILAWNMAKNAGVVWTVTRHTTYMGDPAIVYGIIAWEINGRYLFTALLKVSYDIFKRRFRTLVGHFWKKFEKSKVLRCLKLSCLGLFQLMAVGASGRHGNHAAWHVERDIGHVLARVVIQRQNGMERIALGQISPRKAAVGTNVKVDGCLYL